MFKIRKHNWFENAVSFLVVCLIICFILMFRLVYLIQEIYRNPVEPIQWEYVKHVERSISPLIEIENRIIETHEIEPQYMLYELVEKPLQQTGSLTADLGVFYGPSGKETYYNLPMEGVIKIMKDAGYYMDYAVREDGVKTYGGYVMIAADLNKYPRGTLLETSLGKGLVCDTGEFVNTDVVIDIAVDW